MKHKTSELTGALLDAAVAKALGWPLLDGDTEPGGPLAKLSPNTDWALGGPIIERERISVLTCHPGWEAFVPIKHTSPRLKDAEGVYGPTYLIAAMRAYVASKLGEEVEL